MAASPASPCCRRPPPPPAPVQRHPPRPRHGSAPPPASPARPASPASSPAPDLATHRRASSSIAGESLLARLLLADESLPVRLLRAAKYLPARLRFAVEFVLQARCPFGGPSGVEVLAFTQAIEAHQRRITQAILDHALKICSEKNAEVKMEVMVGEPKEKICEVADNRKADLLVMGCRAIGPLKRMFLGSVSNYCINHVGCPVIVIKGT